MSTLKPAIMPSACGTGGGEALCSAACCFESAAYRYLAACINNISSMPRAEIGGKNEAALGGVQNEAHPGSIVNNK